MLVQNPVTVRYALRPDVVATLLDEGAVLLDLDSKYFYRLNRTGWLVVQCFESGATVEEVKAYCSRCGATAGHEPAIAALLDLLAKDRLIEVSQDLGSAGVIASQDDRTQPWSAPTIEKQSEPLQRVIISAFDPSVPLVE